MSEYEFVRAASDDDMADLAQRLTGRGWFWRWAGSRSGNILPRLWRAIGRCLNVPHEAVNTAAAEAFPITATADGALPTWEAALGVPLSDRTTLSEADRQEFAAALLGWREGPAPSAIARLAEACGVSVSIGGDRLWAPAVYGSMDGGEHFGTSSVYGDINQNETDGGPAITPYWGRHVRNLSIEFSLSKPPIMQALRLERFLAILAKIKPAHIYYVIQ